MDLTSVWIQLSARPLLPAQNLNLKPVLLHSNFQFDLAYTETTWQAVIISMSLMRAVSLVSSKSPYRLNKYSSMGHKDTYCAQVERTREHHLYVTFSLS